MGTHEKEHHCNEGIHIHDSYKKSVQDSNYGSLSSFLNVGRGTFNAAPQPIIHFWIYTSRLGGSTIMPTTGAWRGAHAPSSSPKMTCHLHGIATATPNKKEPYSKEFIFSRVSLLCYPCCSTWSTIHNCI